MDPQTTQTPSAPSTLKSRPKTSVVAHTNRFTDAVVYSKNSNTLNEASIRTISRDQKRSCHIRQRQQLRHHPLCDRILRHHQTMSTLQSQQETEFTSELLNNLIKISLRLRPRLFKANVDSKAFNCNDIMSICGLFG